MTTRNKKSHRPSGSPQPTNSRVTPKGTRPAGVHPVDHHDGGEVGDAPRRLDSHADRGHGKPLPIQPGGSRTGHRGDR